MAIMEAVLLTSQKKIANVSMQFKRYLLTKIDWSNRLISLKGSRGVGKTTLLLQHAEIDLPHDGSTLHVAMDDLFFFEIIFMHWPRNL